MSGAAWRSVALALGMWLVAAGPALAQEAAPGGPDEPLWLGQPRPQGIPERVVSLAPNLTEILFALGAGTRVVGVTRFDDYPPEVERLPRVGGFVDPSLEAILSLRPNLVVCVPNAGNRDRMEALARMGVAVRVLPARRLADVERAIRDLGVLMGAGTRATELVADIRQRIERVRGRVAGVRRPRTLLVYGHKPLVVAGPDSFGGELLELAGGQNAIGPGAVAYPTVPMEELLKLAPEVIVDASASGTGAELSAPAVAAFWARWQALPAVRTGRVVQFDSALWFRPGPRLVEGLERLTVLLHPRNPGDPDPN